MSQLTPSGRLLRLKLLQAGAEVTCTLSTVIRNKPFCHKELKAVNISPIPDQDKKAKSWESGFIGGFCSVLLGFFSV